MRRTAVLFALTFGFVLLPAGTAFAVAKVWPGNCRGTAGDDRLVGSSRANTIYAEDGNDRVLGCGGEDALKWGDGRDEVYGQEGSAGRDTVSGGPGNDIIRGGSHGGTNDGVRDVLDCGDGTDTVYYVQGQDSIANCEILNPPEQ